MPSAERTIIVRPARDTDADAVAEIWWRGWRDGHDGHVPAELAAHRTRESFRRRAPQRLAESMVAVVGDTVTGFVMVVDDEVEQVYVASAYRGSGVAGVLLAEAERFVARTGHDRAWLAVVAGNARARRFYERNGWVDEGAMEYPATTAAGSLLIETRRYAKVVSTREDEGRDASR